MKTKKLSAGLVATVFAVLSALSFAACDFGRTVVPEPGPEPEPAAGLTQLRADGNKVVNANDDIVYLRGVNVGGLFVTEHWMTGFIYGSTPSNDYLSLNRTFIDRFGEEKTQALWQEYRNNWWTDKDFEVCAGMGINCIRLPFTYMNVDFPAIRDNDFADAGKDYDFSALDEFVAKAAEHGIYTILDLHGAYGSHNGQDHSGQIIGDANDVRFYSDERLVGLTADLWAALAEHYKDNPNVAGYDILNEPGEKAGLTTERHFDVFDRLYKAIRATGDEHIVIFESCWDAKDLPMPEEYGWQNCIYSFHHYATSTLSATDHGTDWNNKMRLVNMRFKNVPLYMGEFTNYESIGKWEYVLDLLNRSNWHWTSWTYKVWGERPWGVVNIRGTNADKVHGTEDEYETILEKFKLLRTDGESAQKYSFGNDTLESVFKKYSKADAGVRPEAGEYILYTDDGWLGSASSGGTERVKLVDNYNQAKRLRIRYAESSDDLATLSFGSKAVYMSGNLVVCGSAPNTAAGLFYPIDTEDGIAFVSYSACKYLRANSNGELVADATDLQHATLFVID